MRVLAALSALAALLPTVSALAFPNRGVPLPIGTECAPVVVCESGCCSSYMNLNPNKTVCADAGVCAARGLGDWQFCHNDLSCSSGCCGAWYSNDGLRKCVPSNLKCGVPASPPPSPPPSPPSPPPPPSPPATPPRDNNGSSINWQFTGTATYYNPCDPGQNHGWSCVGSCDNRVTDDSMTVALNSGQYQSNYCERQYVEVLDVNRGSIGRFKIADRCMGCGWGGIDFTPAGWKSLGRGMGEGSFTIKWRFV